MKHVRKGVIAIGIIFAIALLATGGVVAEKSVQAENGAHIQQATPSEAPNGLEANQETVVRVEITNTETGEQISFPGPVDIDSLALPPGEYTAEFLGSDNTIIDLYQFRVSEQEAANTEGAGVFDTAAADADGNREIGVAVGSGYGPDGYTDSVTIYGGVVSTQQPTPAGVADVQLVFEIEYPNGTAKTYERTTGQDGNARLTIETANMPDGEYHVRARSPEVDSTGWGDFSVGLDTHLYPSIEPAGQIGKSIPVTVQVTDTHEPAEGIDRNVTIRRPDGTTTTRTVTTNADGFATFTFTPQQAGRFEVETQQTYGHTIHVYNKSGRIRVNNERFSTRILTDEDVGIMGQIRDDGPDANQGVLVRIVNVSDHDDPTVVTNISTTTNSYGQYRAHWQPGPDTVGEFDVYLLTQQGKRIAAPPTRIDVREPGEYQAPPANLDTELEPNTIAPGGTAEVAISLTDENGPISNTEVSVFTGLTWDNVPISKTTVVTNESGQATASVSIPADAPDGVSLRVRTGATVNDSIVRDTAYGDVQSIVTTDEYPWEVQPGETITYTYTATNTETGEGVANLPLTVLGERFGYQAGTFSPTAGQTNSSGMASVSIKIPSDVSGAIHLGDAAPYEEFYAHPYLQVQSYDVTLPDIGEVQAGETLSFSYTAASPSQTSAELVIKTWESIGENSVLSTQIIEEGEEVSINVPEDVPDNTWYSANLRVVNETGATAIVDESFEVVGGEVQNEPPTASFEYSPADPVAGEQVQMSASGSYDPDGSIETYEWDVDNDGTPEATGETTTKEFTAGSHDIRLTVTDNNGATDSVTKTIEVASPQTTTDFELVLTNATNGLQQYNVSIASQPDAAFTDITPGALQGDQFQILAGGAGEQSVTVRGVDLAGQVGANEQIELVTVSVGGEIAADEMSLTVHSLVNDDGNEIPVEKLKLQTQQSPFDAPIGGAGAPPKDPDGDGLFEDVDGNGEVTFNDAITLAFTNKADLTPEQIDALDMDGDGDVDFDDAVTLAFM